MNKVLPDPKLPTLGAALKTYEYLREHALAINQAADGALHKFVSVSSTYSAGVNDHVILVTPSSTMTVTLPAAKDTINKRVVVKRANNTTHVITVNVAGVGAIDGGTSVTLTTAWQRREFFSNGVQYFEVT